MRGWLDLRLVVIVAAVGLSSNAAWARRNVELGRALYEAQEYEAARKQFVQAYEDQPDAELLFEIALTFQAEGLYRQAQLYFERFVAVAPASSMREEAARLAVLMRRTAERGTPEESRGPNRLLPLFEDTALDLDEDLDDDSLEPFDDDDDSDDDEEITAKQRTARILFWTSSVVAAAAATTLIVSAYNVDHYEDELSDAVEASQLETAPERRIEGDGDACDVAEMRQGPHAERAQQACDYGRSWARTANIMTVGLLATGITSMYFLYVGYLKDDAEDPPVRRSRSRDSLIMPTLGPRQLGMSFELRF
jgi:tetratricopeptide (TPR) repeat protein